MRRERITVNAYELDRRSSLKGLPKTLVFVHGIGVAGNYFIPLAVRLVDEYDIVVLDLPGYGRTPKPDHALTIEELGELVRATCEKMSLTSPILVGQSMGCQIVAYIARTYPGFASKAVLISPSTNNEERSILKQACRLMQDVFRETLKMDVITFSDYIMMGIPRFLKTARYMVADKIEENLAKTTIPVLFIHGAKDKIVPQKWIEYLLSVTPYGSLSLHDKAPHNLHYVRVDEVATAIRKFIT